jgi:ribosomal protein S18 acetylase RimI-like enzyme
MFRSLGVDPGDDHWERFRAAAAQSMRDRRDDDVVVFVVDHPDDSDRLVACGAAVVMTRLPTVGQPDGRIGYIQWMSTDPGYRRRGMARNVLTELLAWLEARGVDNVELHASPDGAPLYRSQGFWSGTGGEALRRRPWDPPPA